MRTTIFSILITMSVVLTHSGFAQAPGQATLSDELNTALVELERRDPHTHADIQRMLEVDPAAAQVHLREYAQYLRELSEAQAQFPEKFALLQDQERLERDVRNFVREFNLTIAEDEQEYVISQLRAVLDNWFELRQSLRELELNRFSGEYEMERGHQRARADERSLMVDEWLVRITDGGVPAMQQRIEMLAAEVDDVPHLAPVIVRLVMRENREAGETLVMLSERNESEFIARLRSLVTEHPELLDRARQLAPEQVRLQQALRATILNAHEHLLPIVSDDRAVDLESDEALSEVLERAVEIELAITDANLREVERKLRTKRAMLEERRARKAVLVEMQLARLVGRADVFEW